MLKSLNVPGTPGDGVIKSPVLLVIILNTRKGAGVVVRSFTKAVVNTEI